MTASVVYSDYNGYGITCPDDENGTLEITAADGEVPYSYTWFNGEISQFIDSLSSGFYPVTIMYANDCFIELDANLTEPNALILDLGEDQTIFLGDSIQIEPYTNLFSVEFQWEDRPGISCLDCREPFVRPFETTTYVATGIMSNGCFQTDSITISVETRRNFFVPNVFSPNSELGWNF